MIWFCYVFLFSSIFYDSFCHLSYYFMKNWVIWFTCWPVFWFLAYWFLFVSILYIKYSIIEAKFNIYIHIQIISIKVTDLNKTNNHARRAYLLTGKLSCFLSDFVISLVFWWTVNPLRTALVSLVLKKIALLLDFLWRPPARFALSFWLRMVKFLAIFFLTVLILANLVADPDDALEFLSVFN